MGIGPYLWVQKTGDVDVEYDGEVLWTYKSATYYNLGVLGKMYLPFPMKGGRMLPFVSAGLGLETVCKPEENHELDAETIEEETESKMALTVRFGFDYWMTQNWAAWVAYHGSKIFASEDDGYGEDVTDMQHDIRVGISTFLTK
jgi:opacity protein-like surface antigen